MMHPMASIRTFGHIELSGSSVLQNKLLLLLCYLAIEGPQLRRHLAQLFWLGATDPANRLSVALSRLRRTHPGCVEADEHRVWTDLVTDTSSFVVLLEEGKTDQAAALYGGHFLNDFQCGELQEELEEWISATRESLARRMVQARLTQAVALAAHGQFGPASRLVEQLQPLVKVALPEPDKLEQLYLISLAGEGKLAPALRAELAEIGVISATGSPEAARVRLRDLSVHNLPRPVNSFSGRKTELASLGGLLHSEHSRLITLTGPGGGGKTRLAVEAGRQQAEAGAFPDGVFWVALEDLSSAAAIPTAIAEALGVSVIGPQASGQLVEALGHKNLLLILDNFEHLLQGVDLLSALVRGCPRLRILVTSRVPLNLDEEWRFSVDGLTYPDPKESSLHLSQLEQYSATQLFLERAIQVNSHFHLQEGDASRLARLCAFVGGSPLALELAAGWVGNLGMEELEGMMENFEIFSSTLRNLPQRHRSIRIVLEQSWQLLSATEQLGLIRLSVFRGGFSVEAALDVADIDIATLSGLVAGAFLRLLPDRRYSQHSLLAVLTHEKAQERLDEHARVQRRHAEYFARKMRTWSDNYLQRGMRKTMEDIARDYDNVQSAWQWSAQQQEAEFVYQMTPGLYAYFTSHAYAQQAFASWALAEARLDRANPAHHAALGQLLATKAMTLMFLNLKDQAIALAEQGLELLRPLKELWGVRYCLAALAICARTPEESERYQTELYQLRDNKHPSVDLNNMSYLKFRLGHFPQAMVAFAEALDVNRAEGDEIGIVFCLYHLGLCNLYTHRPGPAYAWFQQARAFSDTTVSIVHHNDASQVGMARAALELADLERAGGAARGVLERHPPLPFENHKIAARAILLAVEQRRGEPSQAAQRCHGLLTQLASLSAQPDEHGVFALRICAQTCAGFGAYMIAAEILGYVLHHGTAHPFETDKAQGLLAGLEAYLEPTALTAALGRGQGLEIREMALRVFELTNGQVGDAGKEMADEGRLRWAR